RRNFTEIRRADRFAGHYLYLDGVAAVIAFYVGEPSVHPQESLRLEVPRIRRPDHLIVMTAMVSIEPVPGLQRTPGHVQIALGGLLGTHVDDRHLGELPTID